MMLLYIGLCCLAFSLTFLVLEGAFILTERILKKVGGGKLWKRL